MCSSPPVRTPEFKLAVEQPSTGMLEPTIKRCPKSKTEEKQQRDNWRE